MGENNESAPVDVVVDDVHVTDDMGARVLRKIDRRLIPLLFVTYMFNFMDKTILSSASVFGLREDAVSTDLRGQMRQGCHG